jgi:uncharacterized protein (UPF0276 family)
MPPRFSDAVSGPSIGLAYSALVHAFVERHDTAVDHIEIPYELLRHNPRVAAIHPKVPIILHCASLSIAGTEPCPESMICDIGKWADITETPWIGEHLAFITASRIEAGRFVQAHALGEPYNIGYTVSPPMNASTVDRVGRALKRYARRFSVPIIVENSPLYFAMPGSTMAQTRFIRDVSDLADAGLLLDLAHFCITCQTFGVDPVEEVTALPLERVVEIHISGIEQQAEGMWDDHASPAPEIVYRLLECVMERAEPRAITLEYNWSSRFSTTLLTEELDRVRGICKRRASP